jgi:hypothetical protein
MATGWIPALRQAQGELFAGMTATSSAHILQMTPVAADLASVMSRKFVDEVSPDLSGRKRVAHGVSRGYANPPSPPSPSHARAGEGCPALRDGVRASSPRAGALGYPALRDPCRGCGTATRNGKTLSANF